MTRKKPKNRNLDAASLQHRGEKYLKQGSYQEALVSFKKAWQKQPGDPIKHLLIDCYKERINQLKSKQLFKEAAVMWESMILTLKETVHLNLYLNCLIQLDDFDKIITTIDKHPEWLANPATKKQILSAISLPYLLNNHSRFLKIFPELSGYKEQIISLIQMFPNCDNDEQFNSALKAIPFRSPYKEITIVLKNLKALDDSKLKVMPGLKEPYAINLWQLLSSLYQGDMRTIQENAKNKEFIKLFAKCHNWSSEQSKLIQTLIKASDTPLAIFEFIIKNKSKLNINQFQKIAYYLLSHCPKQKFSIYKQIFGSLPTFDEHRITALYFEQQKEYEQAIDYWLYCIESLKKQKECDQNKLKIAILLRRIATITQYTQDGSPAIIANRIQESVKFDPNHADSHLHLIDYFKSKNKTKLQQTITQALAHCPNTKEIILEAAELALNKKSFKKAATLADQCLLLDPLNKTAQNIAREISISEAKTHCSNNDFDIAMECLKSAPSFTSNHLQNLIVTSLSFIANNIKEVSKKSIHELFEQEQFSKYPFTARYSFWMELNRITNNADKKVLNLSKLKVIMADDFSLLVTAYQYYQAKKEYQTNQEYKVFKAALRRCLKGTHLSPEEAMHLCRKLQQTQAFDLLNDAAFVFEKKFDEHPYFMFCKIIAKTKGLPKKASQQDCHTLCKASTMANHIGDQKTECEIEQFFCQTRFFSSMMNFSFGNVGSLINLLQNFHDEDDHEYA